MEGIQFGYLTVVVPAGKDRWGSLLWKCVCLCGDEIITRGTSLRSGNTTSCGVCSHLGLDYIGRKFGFLKVIGRTVKKSPNGRKQYYLICECVCGKQKDIYQHSITTGKTTSCGCKMRETQGKKKLGKRNPNFQHGKWDTTGYKTVVYKRYHTRRRANGGAHTLEDVEQLLREQNYVCFYCKEPLDKYHVDHKTPVSRGGRDDKKNLCCSCPPCNLRKKDKTAAEFIAVIQD